MWRGLVGILRSQAQVEDQLPRCLVITLQRLEVDDKVVLDGEHRVGGKIWVVVGVDLCGA